jgi:DNA-binding transcriptional regulator YhcF (GntR family)
MQRQEGVRLGGAAQRPTNWADLERALLFRLASGSYAPGERLPTCEELAADFGVNKNTASKAYRALAERGYLRTVRGRGTFVVRRPARPELPESVEGVKNLLNLLLQEAKLAGLSKVQLLELVDAAAAQVFQSARLRVAYVECNLVEATAVSRDLQQRLGYPMKPLLLHEIGADSQGVCARFDLLVVNLAHLQELEAHLMHAAPSAKPEIVGLLLSPDPETLTEVARLRPGIHVGVVCDVPASAQKLTAMIAAYNTGIKVTSCVTEREQDVRKLLRSVDVVVAGISSAAHLAEYRPQVPVIRVTWNRLEERSVRELAQLLDDRSRDRDGSDTWLDRA